MKAWIARDADGTARLFIAEPTFRPGIGDGWPKFWHGELMTRIYSEEADRIAEEMGVQPGYCQPITLTATPTGEAKGTP